MIACTKPVYEWHIIQSGFLQREDRPTGSVLLWRDFQDKYASSGVSIELRRWNEDMAALAEFIRLFRPPGSRPTICTYSYSYGGGWGLPRLARELGTRELEIDHAVMCDPVYRHWYPMGAWRAFVPSIPIWIPESVRRVTWFRQYEDWPRGHDLEAENPDRTKIDPPVILRAGHVFIDDSDDYRNECHRVASEVAA